MARGRLSISFIISATVIVLLLFGGVYYLLEQVGVVPIITLTNAAFTAGENAIIFVIALGIIEFLGLLLTFVIFRTRR